MGGPPSRPEAATLRLPRNGDSRGIPAKVAGHSSRCDVSTSPWPLPFFVGYLSAGSAQRGPTGFGLPWDATARCGPPRCPPSGLFPLPRTRAAGDLVPSSSPSCIHSSSWPILCVCFGDGTVNGKRRHEHSVGLTRARASVSRSRPRNVPGGRTDNTAGCGTKTKHGDEQPTWLTLQIDLGSVSFLLITPLFGKVLLVRVKGAACFWTDTWVCMNKMKK